MCVAVEMEWESKRSSQIINRFLAHPQWLILFCLFLETFSVVQALHTIRAASEDI